MASSSSVGSRNCTRSRRRPLRAKCDCEDVVGKWTSWSAKNPGRRFIGCPNFRNADKDCKYFDWVDPPVPNQWYRDMLLEFHNHGYLANQDGFEDFVEEAMEEGVPVAVEAVPVPVEDGVVAGNWKIGFWVCCIIIGWLLMK